MIPKISFLTIWDKKQHIPHLDQHGCTVGVSPKVFISAFGGSFSFCCSTWMPIKVDSIYEFSILELLQSQTYQDIRGSLRDGSFKYCRKDICPEIVSFANSDKTVNHHTIIPLHELPSRDAAVGKVVEIYLEYDAVCNLECPSCRTSKHVMKLKDYPQHILDIHWSTMRSIDELIENGYHVTIVTSCVGDPFASPLMLDMLRRLPDSDNLTLKLYTNGVLASPKRMAVPAIQRRTDLIMISIDAATEPTYNIVRKGGDFSKVVKNLNWIHHAITTGLFFDRVPCVTVNFIVSSMNYFEAAEFAHWITSNYPSFQIWFNKIADWGHFGGNFDQYAVWKETHPDHQHLLSIFSDPVFRHPQIRIGNMAEFLPKVTV